LRLRFGAFPSLVRGLVSVAPHALYFYAPAAHRDLHSFPTRRSSDLVDARGASLACPTPDCDQNLNCTDTRRMRGVNRVCGVPPRDRKSTRLNSSHGSISYAVFCLKKKT